MYRGNISINNTAKYTKCSEIRFITSLLYTKITIYGITINIFKGAGAITKDE